MEQNIDGNLAKSDPTMIPDLENDGKKDEVVHDLERKAELTRSEYYENIGRLERRVNWLRGITLFGSLCISVLALMNQQYFGEFGLLLIAVIGFALAAMAFVDPVFSQSEKLASYRKGAKELTIFIRDCHNYRHDILKNGNGSDIELNRESLRQKYGQIIRDAPDSKYGHTQFLHHKRIFEMKLSISRQISKDPFDKKIEAMTTDLENEIKIFNEKMGWWYRHF